MARKHYPFLYKKNVDGSIQTWWLEQDGDRYRTHSGKLKGKIVVSEWTTAKPKNTGRSNATTSEEQAVAEIESAYTLKRKKGYADSPSDAKKVDKLSPMLAHKYEDYADDVTIRFTRRQSVYVQPKLDGIRCLATAQGLFSRAGNPIVAVPHIVSALAQLFEKHDHLVLDGELYTHTYRDDFPTLVSLIKKQKPSEADLEKSRVIEYHVYDLFSSDPTASPNFGKEGFAARLDALQGLLADIPAVICIVPTLCADTSDDIAYAHDVNLRNGYEGSMLRYGEAPYEHKRSSKLLKYKQWMDDEFVVESIHEGEGNRSKMAGYAVLKLSTGDTFRANIKGTREYLKEILGDASKYVGGQATVEYFHLTPKGKPRFPRVKVFHGKKRDL